MDLSAFAAHICDNVVFVWNVPKKEVQVLAGSYETFGISAQSKINHPEWWLNRIHPDDHRKVFECLTTISSDQDRVACDYRIRNDHGAYIDVLDRAKIIRNDGKIEKFVGVTTNISAIAKIQRDANADRDDAEHKSNTKSRFLATMSHELRTPLSAIIASMEIIRQRSTRKKDLGHLYKIIHRNAHHLLRLVDDILDLSKVESQQFDFEFINVDLPGILSECMETITIQSQEKSIETWIKFHTECPTQITTDPRRLKQILINLLSNALKFTDTGFVGFEVRPVLPPDGSGRGYSKVEELDILTVDSGIGITQEDAPKLFEPFVQLDSRLDRNYQGTGLGLALSKKIATGIGGSLTLLNSVTQPDINHGSCFRLRLPVGTPQKTNIPKTQTAPSCSSNLHQPAQLHGTTILLVDDAEDNRFLMAKILERQGAVVHSANNGAECLKLLDQSAERIIAGNNIDLVLLDIEMPVMDGPTTLKAIKTTRPALPVVALTAHAMADHYREYLNMGFDGYMSKPIDRTRLIELVTRLTKAKTAHS